MSSDSDETYFDVQEEAWFDGGREWYMKNNPISDEEVEISGIPGDFDPYVFFAETIDEE